MTVYDSMTPFENVEEDGHKVSERPRLQIATPEAGPTKVHDPGFDWSRWDAHANIKPASPSSLPSLDHPSPTSEDLSHRPKCRKCGLTTTQHEQVKRFICGHLCRDIPQDNLCPDIDALYPSSRDCPIHSPGTTGQKVLTRRRSSLSKPPMLARDESTYADWGMKPTSAKLTDSPVEEDELFENMKQIQHEEYIAPDKATYQTSRDAEGDADWLKHCRVEKAMQQMFFGNARVSPHVMLEHTQKVRGNESFRKLQSSRDDYGSNDDDDDDHEVHNAISEDMTMKEKQTEQGKECGGTAEGSSASLENFDAAQAERTTHNLDCAIASDEEEQKEEEGEEAEEEAEAEAEADFQGAMLTARPATYPHGCASDDECSSCAVATESSDASKEPVAAESQQMWMDRSRAC
jgi:hypothetical protein